MKMWVTLLMCVCVGGGGVILTILKIFPYQYDILVIFFARDQTNKNAKLPKREYFHVYIM